MARRDRWMGGAMGLVLLGGSLVLGCTSPNPAFGLGGSDEGSGDGATGSAEETQGPATTQSDPPATGGMSGVSGTSGMSGSGDPTTGAQSTGVEQCSPPAEPTDYGRCTDATCEGTCLLPETPEGVDYDQSVCASPCIDECDCPKPTDGEAEPTCGRDGCILECTEGRRCPHGMTCDRDEGLCVRVDAYGPCGGSCPSGACFGLPMFGDTCPVLDCLGPTGVDASVCPPGPDGNAEPFCFEPGNFPGQGWCVLRCASGETCPTGMECGDDFCFHT